MRTTVCLHLVPALCLVFWLMGCEHDTSEAPAGRASRTQTPAPTAPAPAAVKTELYFGLTRPGGGSVSETEWSQFLDQEVTPRFREGLTVLDAYGQYLNQAGTLVRERTKVVILYYAPAAERETGITALIEAYKRSFQQESVLRASVPAQVSF